MLKAAAIFGGTLGALQLGSTLAINHVHMKSLDVSSYMFDQPYNSQLPLIAHVDGPLNVSHYVIGGKDPKEFYIFGDTHATHRQCTQSQNTVPIPKIFDLIIKANPQVTVDFFIENSYSQHIFQSLLEWRNIAVLSFQNKQGGGTMAIDLFNTHTFFKNCDVSRALCARSWPNLRYHGIDIRKTKVLDDVILFVTRQVSKVDLYRFENTYLDGDERWKMNKEIEGIVDIDMRNKVSKYINDLLAHNAYEYAIARDVRDMDRPNDDDRRMRLRITLMFMRLSFIMDGYTLGRMFRSFGGYSSKYIIMYAGEYHCKTVRDFLDSLSPTNVIKCGEYVQSHVMDPNLLDSVKSQCVNTSTLQLPVFTTAPTTLPIAFKQECTRAFTDNNFRLLDAAYYQYYKTRPLP